MKQIVTGKSRRTTRRQVSYCHDTHMHCICVVGLVKPLGFSALRSLEVWALAFHALHR